MAEGAKRGQRKVAFSPTAFRVACRAQTTTPEAASAGGCALGCGGPERPRASGLSWRGSGGAWFIYDFMANRKRQKKSTLKIARALLPPLPMTEMFPLPWFSGPLCTSSCISVDQSGKQNPNQRRGNSYRELVM